MLGGKKSIATTPRIRNCHFQSAELNRRFGYNLGVYCHKLYKILNTEQYIIN